MQVLLTTSQLVQPVAEANPMRLDIKRREFLQLRRDADFLAWRAEIVVAHRLATCGAAFGFGNPKVANPDLILTPEGIGIEVTTASPVGVEALLNDLDEVLEPARMVALVQFDHCPVRLRDADRQPLVSWVESVAAEGETSGGIRGFTFNDPKNSRAIELTVSVFPVADWTHEGRVTFETTAGDLTAALAAVDDAVMEKTRDLAKVRQAQAIPTVLLLDVTRVGAGWMRPARVWAQSLANRLDSSFPFIGIGVLLTHPEIFTYEIGLAPAPRHDAAEGVARVAEALKLGPA